jgi:hypothetical protein
MSAAMTDERKRKWKKAGVSSLIGAAVGAGTVSLALWAAGEGLLAAMGPSRIVLGGIGLVFVLVGAMVGFGLAAPRAGAKLLNVGDAEELVEDRPKLLSSALYMGWIGVTLLLLALARTPDFAAGIVAPGVALAALAVLMVVSLLSYTWMRSYDEFDRQLGLEGASWAFLIAAGVLLPWAAFDALGWNAPLASLDVIAVLAISLIAGSFVAVARRGMMVR